MKKLNPYLLVALAILTMLVPVAADAAVGACHQEWSTSFIAGSCGLIEGETVCEWRAKCRVYSKDSSGGTHSLNVMDANIPGDASGPFFTPGVQKMEDDCGGWCWSNAHIIESQSWYDVLAVANCCSEWHDECHTIPGDDCSEEHICRAP